MFHGMIVMKVVDNIELLRRFFYGRKASLAVPEKLK